MFSGIATDMAILDNRKGQEKNAQSLQREGAVLSCLLFGGVGAVSDERRISDGTDGALHVQYWTWHLFYRKQQGEKRENEKNGKRLVGLIAFGKSKGAYTRKQSEAKRLPLEELCVFKEVPRQWMNQILEAARLAPSSLNSQPWRFVVYDNRIHIFSKKYSVEKLKKMGRGKFRKSCLRI